MKQDFLGNGDFWFGELVEKYEIDHEIVELAALKDGELLQHELWQTSVCAPLLGWHAACNCRDKSQCQRLENHVAEIVKYALLETEKRHGPMGLPMLASEIDSSKVCLVTLGSLVKRAGLAIDYLGRLEQNNTNSNKPFAIGRWFPHNVSMAIENAELVMSHSFRLANPNAPAFYYLFEDKFREKLKYDDKHGIVVNEAIAVRDKNVL